MQQLLGKLVLILLVVLGSVAAFYPPSERLKKGIDLGGGTIVTYQVLVEPGQDAETIVQQVMQVWKNRLDPNGVRNLSFSPIAGNRVQITMARASEAVRQLRDAYQQARQALLEANLDEAEIDAALRKTGDERVTALQAMAGDSTELFQKLDTLGEKYDAMAAAREPYEAAQAAHRAAERELADLPQDADEATRTQLQQKVDALLEALIERTRAFNEARTAYEKARAPVFDGNIPPARVEAAIGLLEGIAREQIDRRLPRFNEAFEQLKKDYPDHATAIETLRTSYLEYARQRGPFDDAYDMIRILEGSGVLEFRLAAKPASSVAPPTPGNIEDYRKELREKGPRVSQTRAYSWFEVGEVSQFVREEAQREALERQPEDTDEAYEARVAAIFTQSGLVAQPYAGKYYVLLGNDATNSITRKQPGWRLTRAFATRDQRQFPAVAVELDPTGGDLMNALTRDNVGELLSITLDGKIMNAANIESALGTNFQITNARGFSQAEIEYLVRTLAAGSLDASVQGPISIKTVNATFGTDNLQRGLMAGVYALIAVTVFMAVYYFFCGMVANFALVANVAIILGVMAILQGTFTLPGIAGIILTIGMAVDANVLIFERIREELEAGSDVPTSVRLGFDRAFSTIIDANVTTLITCLILYNTATVEVKGFALTLMIGILATLFTAMFSSHVLINLYVKMFRPRTLSMLPTAVPAIGRLLNPSIDWISLRRPLQVGSLVLIVVGIGAIVSRGADLLDIEFRGGTQVQFELGAGKTLGMDEARKRLDVAADSIEDPATSRELRAAPIVSVGAPVSPGEYNEFTVTTLAQDQPAVEQALARAFNDVLDVQQAVRFVGMEEPSRETIYPIQPEEAASAQYRWELGGMIGVEGLRDDMRSFAGGAAIVIRDMDQPLSLTEIERRLNDTRLRSDLPYRRTKLVGLDLAPTPEGEAARYTGFVHVVADETVNYIDSPDELLAPGGVAVTEWQVVVDALTQPRSIGSVVGIDGQVSGTMRNDALLALGLAMLAIVAYIWVRFGNLKYGIAAIAALIHDVTIALGLVAASKWLANDILLVTAFRIDLAMVAAFLTIVGYSLNDTIVVFDRIRENRGKLITASPKIINNSINQTISRTVLTSGTTVLALLTLYIVGGPGVHSFAYTMLVGILIGTYSSIAIAAPILLVPAAKLSRVCGSIALIVAAGLAYFGFSAIAADFGKFGGWAVSFFALIFLAIALSLFLAARAQAKPQQTLPVPAS